MQAYMDVGFEGILSALKMKIRFFPAKSEWSARHTCLKNVRKEILRVGMRQLVSSEEDQFSWIREEDLCNDVMP